LTGPMGAFHGWTSFCYCPPVGGSGSIPPEKANPKANPIPPAWKGPSAIRNSETEMGGPGDKRAAPNEFGLSTAPRAVTKRAWAAGCGGPFRNVRSPCRSHPTLEQALAMHLESILREVGGTTESRAPQRKLGRQKPPVPLPPKAPLRDTGPQYCPARTRKALQEKLPVGPPTRQRPLKSPKCGLGSGFVLAPCRGVSKTGLGPKRERQPTGGSPNQIRRRGGGPPPQKKAPRGAPSQKRWGGGVSPKSRPGWGIGFCFRRP